MDCQGQTNKQTIERENMRRPQTSRDVRGGGRGQVIVCIKFCGIFAYKRTHNNIAEWSYKTLMASHSKTKVVRGERDREREKWYHPSMEEKIAPLIRTVFLLSLKPVLWLWCGIIKGLLRLAACVWRCQCTVLFTNRSMNPTWIVYALQERLTH